MYKKLLVLFMLFFSVFCLFGCGGGEETPDVDLTEMVDVPTNLSITGKVLTWDAVAGATGYIVYADGVEKATVTATTYDFSSLPGTTIIFQVVAKAPKGTNNSAKSVTAAYMSNPAGEITEINALLADVMPNVPEGFVEELVRKGMTSDDAQALKTAFQTLQTEMEAADGDPLLSNAAIKKFLLTDINFEALISAAMLAAVPSLESQIASAYEDISYYQGELDAYGPNEYYSERIVELNNEIDVLGNMVDLLTESRDEAVIVAVNTINYLREVHGAVTDDLISKIVAITDVESPSELTAEELLTVKDEVLDIFLENLPAMADLTMVYELLSVGYTQMFGSNAFSVMLSDSSTQFAAETYLTVSFALNYLNSFDLAFFQDFLTAVQDHDQGAVIGSELAILFVTYYKDFEDGNQALLDQIDAVFTEAQKEQLYNNSIAAMNELTTLMGADVDLSMMGEISYAVMNGASGVFDDMTDKLLDKFVATDGELLRMIVISNSFECDYNYMNDMCENFRNTATGETYANESDYYRAQDLAEMKMIKEALTYYAPTIGTMTDAQITSLIDLLAEAAPVEQLASENGMTLAEAQAFADLVEATLRSIAPDVHDLLNNLMAYAVDNDLIMEINQLQSSIKTYYVTAYGEEYYNNPAYFEDDYEQNAITIFICQHIDAFFNSANQTLARGLITDLATLAKNESVYSMMEMTLDQVNALETQINDAFDGAITKSAIIKDYDPASLTAAQLEEIAALQALFQGIGPQVSEKN